MPQISVIVPVYKAEAYLDKCIQSILSQTFTDLELILVDDGSPDNCPQMCNEWAKRDSRIIVIHKENGGVSSARNAGIMRSSGEYIMFCDSDDIVYPTWCETLYNIAQNNSNALISTDVSRLKTAEAEDIFNSFISKKEAPYYITPSFPAFEDISYFALYKLGISGYTMNKIFYRNIITSNNILFDPQRPIGEDVEFIVKYCLCANIKKFLYIPTSTYIYIQNEESASHKKRCDWLKLHLYAFQFRLPFISPEELGEYCDIWLYQFMQMFDYIFDKNIKMSHFKKMKYNQKMLESEQFQFCLHNCTGKNENPKIINFLKNKRYYAYYIYSRLAKFKRASKRK